MLPTLYQHYRLRAVCSLAILYIEGVKPIITKLLISIVHIMIRLPCLVALDQLITLNIFL